MAIFVKINMELICIMKRLVVILVVLLAFSFAADAQFAVGGNFSINIDRDWTFKNGSDKYGYSENSFLLSLNPKFYYNIKDNMQVGARVGFFYGRMTGEMEDVPFETVKVSGAPNIIGWGFTPFYNLRVYSYSKVSIWLEADLFFNDLYNNTHDAIPLNMWHNQLLYGFQILPVFSWEINDTHSLDIHLGFISAGWLGTVSFYRDYYDVTSSWDIRKGGFDGLIQGFTDYGIGLTRRF